MKRGIVDNMRLSCRPYRFDFENNEDEERAIAEAIAREEELMRIEEESKANDGQVRTDLSGRDATGRPYADQGRFGATLFGGNIFNQLSKQPLTYSSNLMPTKEDTPDQKIIKQVLDTLITQVCRWDKQFGWYKNHLKKPRIRVDVEKFRSRRMFANQREMILAEHVDRLRKEINKRRTRLENKAEEQCGLLTPWRKARGRPNRVPKRIYSPEAHRPRRVVNPAEISLGGDSVDWTKSELPEEPIQTTNINNEDELKEDNVSSSSKTKKLESVMEPAEEAFTVADWQPKRKGPALSTPSQDKEQLNRVKVDDSSADELSSLRSESRSRRGRPHKRENDLDQLEKNHDDSEAASERPPPEGMDPLALHCICQTPYNSRKFYVGCDLCFRWFHGRCVDVSERSAKRMDGWTCRDCLRERAREEQQLYCTCQTPYDDTQFYVGCDGCEGWFHPRCVGITQEAAEAMAEYMCPNCQEAHTAQGYESNASNSSSIHPALSRADYPLVWRLLDTISEHRMAWPFHHPVDIKEFPTYNEIVKNPIDLSIIQKKIEHLEYHQLKDFTRDMTQMFGNAKLFNPKGSAIYLCADTLEKIFEHHLMEVRAEIEGRSSEGRKASESQTIDSSLDIDTDQLIDVNLDVDPSMFLL